MATDFVHLHTHSHYSLLDGAGKVPELLKKAQELGMASLAITDHGAMYGAVEFYETAKKLGVKPIIGVESYMARRTRFDKDSKKDVKPYHQLLLAETFEGYKNLIKMTSEAYMNGFYYKPRIDKDLLREHKNGIIATSSCLNGEIPRSLEISWDEGRKALDEYLDIFGANNFYLEVQPDRGSDEQRVLNDQLKRMASEYGLKLVATNDIHYINSEDSEAQDVLVCVSSGKTVNDPNRLNMTAYDLSMFSGDKMAELMKDYPGSIESTVEIAERCNVTIPLGDNILPKYPLPEGVTDRAELRRFCGEGVKKRFGLDYTPREDRVEGEILVSPMNDFSLPLIQRISDRLEYELSVIEMMGFESYFLIVQDFINWAKDQGIAVGPGRGSAAGSLVGYLIGITDIDPLFHKLIFERFLNPERISMPDIDTDIEDARRGEVIDYTRSRYGADHVAQIITFGTMASRAAIRDVGRALGVSYADCDYIAKLIPSGPQGLSIKDALATIPDLKQLYDSNEQFTQLLDIASKLEGVARHTSIHAAGVVISKDPITEYVPIQRATKDENIIVTQYAQSQVEHLGLLKMDFLGLANLSILLQAKRIIRKTRDVDVDIDHLPLDDKPSYELLARAETTGVFQLESSGMKRYLKELKPTTFEDIMSMVALYRPGPMDAIPDFIESKHGRKKITYLHPILEPILKDSYGVIVTQDQVLETARKFAGFTYGQADVLRKAVGKKIKALLDEQREKFIQGAVKTNADQGVTEKLATQVWEFVEPFARYGFNRAHAACYALIAYQTAYLKAHYPVEFMASLLTSDINNLDRVGIEISECRDMGVEVLPPDVMESFVEFGVVFYNKDTKEKPKDKKRDAYVRFGLGAIKNVGQQAAEYIVEERKANGPFKDFPEFLRRNAAHLNKKVLENLAMAGALDSLCERQSVLHNMEVILRFTSAVSKGASTDQASLFDDIEMEEDIYTLPMAECPPADQKTRLAWERELLGIYLSDHPISTYVNYLPQDRQQMVALSGLEGNTPVRVCGIVMTVRKILTKKGDNMAFLSLEDETGACEAVAFPKIWKDKEKILEPGMAVVIDGKISARERRTIKKEPGEEGGTEEPSKDTVSIIIDTCAAITEARPTMKKNPTTVTIKLPDSGDRELLQKIKGHLESNPGRVPVTLMVPTVEGDQPMRISHTVEPGERLYSQLAYLIGGERVIFD